MTKNIFINIIIVLFVSSFLPKNLKADGGEEKALEYFNKGQYKEAIPLYDELLRYYPNDPMFNYYWGVSKTEKGYFEQKVKRALLFASTNDAPNKVYLYIGKQYHAAGDFETALSYYQRFQKKSKKKEMKKVGLNELIEQCNREESLFNVKVTEVVVAEVKPATEVVKEVEESIEQVDEEVVPVVIEEIVSEEVKEEVKEEPYYIDAEEKLDSALLNPVLVTEEEDKNVVVMIDVPDTTEIAIENKVVVEVEEEGVAVEVKPENMVPEVAGIPDELKNEAIQLAVNSRIVYKSIDDFKTEEGKEIYVDAWEKGKKLNNVLTEVENLRNEYSSASDDQKITIATQVLELESQSMKLKPESDQLLLKTIELENGYWNEAPESLWEQFITEQRKAEMEKEATVVEEVIQPEVVEGLVVEEVKPIEQMPENRVQIEYRVQIGAYSKGLPGYVEKLYSRLSKLRKIENYKDDRGVVVYTVGRLNSYKDAVNMQKQIRIEGIKDAFVVAYKNGERIRVSEARKLQSNE